MSSSHAFQFHCYFLNESEISFQIKTNTFAKFFAEARGIVVSLVVVVSFNQLNGKIANSFRNQSIDLFSKLSQLSNLSYQKQNKKFKIYTLGKLCQNMPENDSQSIGLRTIQNFKQLNRLGVNDPLFCDSDILSLQWSMMQIGSIT